MNDTLCLRKVDILDFWFGQEDEGDSRKPRKVWFAKKPQFDQEIRTCFMSDYQLAATGQLDSWRSSPSSCLALILLLDQFPRHMFRGTPQAFATDPQALSCAQHAIASGYDRQMPPVQRWFVYLPLEHSEDIAAQRQSVNLFRQMSNDSDSASTISWAIKHMEVIERFGRFPHRNKILGRVTTPEEEEFLKQPGSLF